MSERNRYAPPTAKVRDLEAPAHDDLIARLDVSDTWKKRFRSIEKAGGPRLPKFRELSRSERTEIGFNTIAFLTGPIYYLAKGMWRKAIAFTMSCIVVLALLFWILELMGFGAATRNLGWGVAALFATRADIDYYKKKVLDDDGWW